MRFKWLVLIVFVVIVFLVPACSANESLGLPDGAYDESLSAPEQAYIHFWRACEAGDLSEAETHLSDKSIELLQDYRAKAVQSKEGDPTFEALQKWGDPCFMYLHNSERNVEYGRELSSKSDRPDAIRYWELNTTELGEDSGYEGVAEMAALQWFYEGKIDPSGENPPSENTTYISTIEVVMIKIDGEWKIDCGWC